MNFSSKFELKQSTKCFFVVLLVVVDGDDGGVFKLPLSSSMSSSFSATLSLSSVGVVLVVHHRPCSIFFAFGSKAF